MTEERTIQEIYENPGLVDYARELVQEALSHKGPSYRDLPMNFNLRGKMNFLCPFDSKFSLKGNPRTQFNYFEELKKSWHLPRFKALDAKDILIKRIYWRRFSENAPDSLESKKMFHKWESSNFLGNNFTLYHPDGRMIITFGEDTKNLLDWEVIKEGLKNPKILLGEDSKNSLENFERVYKYGSHSMKLNSEEASNARDVSHSFNPRVSGNLSSIFPSKASSFNSLFDVENKHPDYIKRIGKIVFGNPEKDFAYVSLVGIGGKNKNFDIYLDGSLDGSFVFNVETGWHTSRYLSDDICLDVAKYLSEMQSPSSNQVLNIINRHRLRDICGSTNFDKDAGQHSLSNTPGDFLTNQIMKLFYKKKDMGEEISPKSLDALMSVQWDVKRKLESHIRYGTCKNFQGEYDSSPDFDKITDLSVNCERARIEDKSKDAIYKLKKNYNVLVENCGEDYANRCLEKILNQNETSK